MAREVDRPGGHETCGRLVVRLAYLQYTNFLKEVSKYKMVLNIVYRFEYIVPKSVCSCELYTVYIIDAEALWNAERSWMNNWLRTIEMILFRRNLRGSNREEILLHCESSNMEQVRWMNQLSIAPLNHIVIFNHLLPIPTLESKLSGVSFHVEHHFFLTTPETLSNFRR